MKTSHKPLDLCAAVTQWSDVEANAADASPRRLRRFSMTAYTGGAMDLFGWKHPVVVDLTGLKIARPSRPILKDHRRDQIVGHTDRIDVVANQLRVAGVISGTGPVAEEIVALSENGFPWQASIGAKARQVAFVPAGRKATVNGRELSGPLHIVRRATLGEISFVALGADDRTMAKVAAGQTLPSDKEPSDKEPNDKEKRSMEFEAWVEAQGFTAEELTDTQAENLKRLFEASRKEKQVPDGEALSAAAAPRHVEATAHTPEKRATEAPDEKSAVDGTSTGAVTASADVKTEVNASEDPVSAMRAAYASDLRRIAAIEDLCGTEYRKLATRAVAEGWDVQRTELEVLRAARPQAPAIGASKPTCNATLLEAAACLSAGVDENTLVQQYGDRIVEAAHPLRSIGLRELVAECARLEGHDVPRVFGDGTATIRAGFSTLSLSGILENVMNKTMLAAYEATPIAALQLCAISSVSDFKEVTRYRLLGTGGFEKVAPDGELKHGALSDHKYTNQADTYGQILMLTRRDIINDDLNAFMDIPRQMGRSGAESIDDLFFTLLLSNPSSFFGAGNGNYLSGADTAFGPDALTSARTLFRKQKAGPGSKAKNQKPINVRPVTLVVPVELETEAELLMGAAQLMIATGSDTTLKFPTDNPHRNKYRVVSVPHLSDSYYTGSSSKAWYLLADPTVIPAFELVFLNGRRTPVIERIEAPANMLGMGFRGYLDVGVQQQDPRGAVKIKGEA